MMDSTFHFPNILFSRRRDSLETQGDQHGGLVSPHAPREHTERRNLERPMAEQWYCRQDIKHPWVYDAHFQRLQRGVSKAENLFAPERSAGPRLRESAAAVGDRLPVYGAWQLASTSARWDGCRRGHGACSSISPWHRQSHGISSRFGSAK